MSLSEIPFFNALPDPKAGHERLAPITRSVIVPFSGRQKGTAVGNECNQALRPESEEVQHYRRAIA